jgi:hypothetical protein
MKLQAVLIHTAKQPFLLDLPATDTERIQRSDRSGAGHLAGSTTICHLFWTTSFFSDTLTIILSRGFVNIFPAEYKIVLLDFCRYQIL